MRQEGEAVKEKIENRRTRARARAALFVTGRAARFAVLFTFRARRAVCQKAVPLCRAIREKIVSSPYAARVLFPCRAGVADSSFSPSHLAPPCPPLPPPPPSPFSNASSTEKKWSGKRLGRCFIHAMDTLRQKQMTTFGRVEQYLGLGWTISERADAFSMIQPCISLLKPSKRMDSSKRIL